jgi:hypothetical protein
LPGEADERQGFTAVQPAEKCHDGQGNQPSDAGQDQGSHHEQEEDKKHQECEAERSKKSQVESDGR